MKKLSKFTTFSIFTASIALQAGLAIAQSIDSGQERQLRHVQAAAPRTEAPSMNHQTAHMIKIKNDAEAKYRRTGNDQDLARVKVMEKEIASRGYGHATQPAPYQKPNQTDANWVDAESSLIYARRDADMN